MAQTTSVGIRLTGAQEQAIEQIVDSGAYVSVSEFVRDAVREKLQAVRILEGRNLTERQAEKEIVQYLQGHEEAYASDIAADLRIDIDLVLSVLHNLRDNGKVE